MRTANRKGKARGNNAGNAVACQSGAATSAAKMNRRAGVALPEHIMYRMWIPGEGWVRWCEIERQFAKAFDAWRWRKAMEGIRIVDGAERRAAEIASAEALRDRGVAA